MRPVVLFAPPRGVAALAAFLASCRSRRFDPARAQDATRSAETLPADRCHLHPHRHSYQQLAAAAAPRAASSDTPSSGDIASPPASGTPSSAALPGLPRPSSPPKISSASPATDAAGNPFARSRHPDRPACIGGVNGAGTRWTCAASASRRHPNTLVLVDGRRFNDSRYRRVRSSASIPRDSIERIEITRGNSGAVLYGDGRSAASSTS